MALIRTARDLRIDFFRGVALWWIFVDHIGANWLNRLSLRNFALCDATEVFVLLAGYSAGMAYGRRMDRRGWLSASADAVGRAWTLYIAHIFLFVVFAAQVTYSAGALDRRAYLDEIHLDILGEAPYRALFEALLLRFQPAYLDILPMYIALLLMFAAALPLLRRPRILLALSLLVYAAARLGSYNLPSWTATGWYFNPLTWQLLFMLGAVFAYAPRRVSIPTRAADISAVIVVIFGLIEQWVIFDHPALTSHFPLGLSRVLLSVDKTSLHPFRLASILAFAWLVRRSASAQADWLRTRIAGVFILCGQHSLPVFCSGIFLSFLGRLTFEAIDTWWTQLAVNVAGAASLVAVGAIAAWYRTKDQDAGGAAPRVANA